MTGGDPEYEVLLARSRGKKRATTVRRHLGRRIKATGAAILDEAAFRVDGKGMAQVLDRWGMQIGTVVLSEATLTADAIKPWSPVASTRQCLRFNRLRFCALLEP